MSARDVNARVHGDVVVVELGRSIDSTCAVVPLVAGFLEQGFLRFLLDLRQAQHVDSSGLAAVVRTFIMVGRKTGQLKLLNVPKRVRVLLDVMKLTSVFEMFESEENALKSFGGTTPVDRQDIEARETR